MYLYLELPIARANRKVTGVHSLALLVVHVRKRLRYLNTTKNAAEGHHADTNIFLDPGSFDLRDCSSEFADCLVVALMELCVSSRDDRDALSSFSRQSTRFLAVGAFSNSVCSLQSSILTRIAHTSGFTLLDTLKCALTPSAL